jgi:hypothetical protein
MYCHNCGVDNIQDARFCRKCGSGIGQPAVQPYDLAQVEIPQTTIKRGRPPVYRAAKKISTGLALVCIAIFGSLTHERWGLWILLPAFILIMKGITMLVELKATGQLSAPYNLQPRPVFQQPVAIHQAPPTAPDRRAQTSQVTAPPSITEGTTRIIPPDAEEHYQRP